MAGGIIPAIIVGAGIIVSAILVSPGINKVGTSVEKIGTLAEKFVKNQAIDGCYQAGRVTRTTGTGEDAQTIEIPESSWLNSCLKDKGLK